MFAITIRHLDRPECELRGYNLREMILPEKLFRDYDCGMLQSFSESFKNGRSSDSPKPKLQPLDRHAIAHCSSAKRLLDIECRLALHNDSPKKPLQSGLPFLHKSCIISLCGGARERDRFIYEKVF